MAHDADRLMEGKVMIRRLLLTPAFVCEVAVAQLFTTPGGCRGPWKSMRNKHAGFNYLGDRDLWRHKCLDQGRTPASKSDSLHYWCYDHQNHVHSGKKTGANWSGLPDIHPRTYILPPIFSSFFRRLIFELSEWNSLKIGHMVGSKCCRLNGLHCLLLTPKKSASVMVHLVPRRSLTIKVDCTAIR